MNGLLHVIIRLSDSVGDTISMLTPEFVKDIFSDIGTMIAPYWNEFINFII